MMILKNLHIEEYIDYCHFECGHRTQTIKTNRNLLYRLARYLPAEFDLCNISEKIFYDYLSFLTANGCSENTIRHNRTVIICFLKYLDRKNNLKERFVPDSRRITRKLYDVLTAKEAYSLCAANDTDSLLGIRDRAILEIVFSAGLRASEITNLEVTDIDLKSGRIKINGKGGKQRIGFINPSADYWLKRYLGLREEFNIFTKTLFVSNNQRKLEASFLKRLVDRSAKRAGIKKHVTIHTLRRTFATLLMENEMDISYVQMLLGHRSVNTTQLYIMYQTKHLRRALELHPRNKAKTEKSSIETIQDKINPPAEPRKEKPRFIVEIRDRFFNNIPDELKSNSLFANNIKNLYLSAARKLVHKKECVTTAGVIQLIFKSYGIEPGITSLALDIFEKAGILELINYSSLNNQKVYNLKKLTGVKISREKANVC